MKEGGVFSYCSFPEPWVGKDGRVYPGWEMFFNEKLTFKEKPTMVIKEMQKEVDWVNYMDVEAMKTMMKMSGDVFAITNEELSDPSKFIMPVIGPINNWTWVGFSKNMGKMFCNANSNVLFNIFNRGNCTLPTCGLAHFNNVYPWFKSYHLTHLRWALLDPCYPPLPFPLENLIYYISQN